MPPLGRQLNDLEMVGCYHVAIWGCDYRQWPDAFSEVVKVARKWQRQPRRQRRQRQPRGGGQEWAELVQQWGCNACHKFDGPDRLVGPSLWDIGARQDTNYIREAILQPDAVVTRRVSAAGCKRR